MAFNGQQACSISIQTNRKKIGSCVSIQMVKMAQILQSSEQQEMEKCFNPFSGKIPILIDNTQNPPFTVMESCAEVLYLQENVDKGNVFGFDHKVEQSEAVQWLIFWQASGQPQQGQMNHFRNSAPERIPCELDDNLMT